VQRRRLPGTIIGAVGLYALLVQGKIAPDLGIGRRTRPLGPLMRHIDAPPEVVFDVIAAPYLGKTPKAMESKLKVLERGSDMVLAAHYTKTSFGLTATTVETVRFERPSKVYFQLVRGPVPAVSEIFELVADPTGTQFHYTGELGTDLWALGAKWGDRVAAAWEDAVESSVASITAEAERRAG
jgi:hypothetical protein